VEQQTIGGVAALQVSGELDLATAGKLEAKVERALTQGSSPLLIDFTDCGFIDSSVLSLLVKLHRRLGNSIPPRLVVVAREQPLQVLRLTRLDCEMAVFASLGEALSALQVGGAAES
jgi:anti-sigma B factor antagonist